MHIQVNTDNHIKGSDKLSQRIEATVESSLSRFAERLTRVEVHLADENGPKGGGDDIKCTMEARPAGMQPLVATDSAATLDEACQGAADKLARLLDTTFGKLTHR